MTVGLTVLIWVFSDQLLRESDTVLVNIRPVTAGARGMTVSSPPGTTAPFRVKVSGPRKVIARKTGSTVPSVDLPITERPTGRYSLDLRRELERVPEAFAELSVDSVEPETLEVIVDHNVRATMPVRVDPGTFDFAVKPTVDPAEVEVTISEIALNGLSPDVPGIPPEKRQVRLTTERYLSDFPPGELFSRDVALDQRVGDIEAKLRPSQVRLVARLRERLKEATIPAVPIIFQAGPSVFNRYLIDSPDNFTLLTQSITIKGPDDVVARMVSGQVKVFGVIMLTTPEAKEVGTFQRVTPSFVLPPGITLVDEPTPVEFRLLPSRPAPGAEGSAKTEP
jgi:hypothetical protein